MTSFNFQENMLVEIQCANCFFYLISQGKMLCGDVLLITAFVSYVGYFTRSYRLEFLNDLWLPFMTKQAVRVDSKTTALFQNKFQLALR